MTTVKEDKIAKACNILFGEDFTVDKDTINYIQISGIKRAFRTKVKECHPDIAIQRGEPENAEKQFITLKAAYDFLVSVKTTPAAERSYAKKESSARSVPRRRLRLGEYLYYAGKIDWNQFISAMAWQNISEKKNSRKPRIGDYFIINSILSPSEIGFSVFKMNIHNSNY